MAKFTATIKDVAKETGHSVDEIRAFVDSRLLFEGEHYGVFDKGTVWEHTMFDAERCVKFLRKMKKDAEERPQAALVPGEPEEKPKAKAKAKKEPEKQEPNPF